MDKKNQTTDQEQQEKERLGKEKEIEKEETGFPEDIDFKKFLGCGG